MGVKVTKFINDYQSNLNRLKSFFTSIDENQQPNPDSVSKAKSIKTSTLQNINSTLLISGDVFLSTYLKCLHKVIDNKNKITDLKNDSIFIKFEPKFRSEFLKIYPDTNFTFIGLTGDGKVSSVIGTVDMRVFSTTTLREALLEKEQENNILKQFSGSQSNSTLQQPVKATGDFIIKVSGSPSTDTQKIEGVINFISANSIVTGNASLYGFPDNYLNKNTKKTIISSTYSITTSQNTDTPSNRLLLANETLNIFESKFKSDYGFDINLKIEDLTKSAPTGNTTETSQTSIWNNDKVLVPTTVQLVDGEFIFDVQTGDYFINNGTIGSLFIVGKGEIYENVVEQDELDSEYVENSYKGAEEGPIVYENGGFITIDSDSTNSLKGVDPENFNDSLSTDSNSKYPIDKNTDANIKKIISVSKDSGLTNKYAIAAMLAICKKESGFVPRGEASYSGTAAARIKSVFSKFRSYSDDEVNTIKKNAKQFFDIIYGGKYGNASDEGFKYRGRGFNQITFKGNYSKYKGLSGHDIVNDPDLLNKAEVAAKCLVEYFKSNFKLAPSGIKSKYNFSDINSFTSLDDATGAFYHANAGWGNSYSSILADPTGGRAKAFKYAGPLYNTYLK